MESGPETGHGAAAESDLYARAREVNGIRLVGAPDTLIIDEMALVNPDGKVPLGLRRKLTYLLRDERMTVYIVRSSLRRPEDYPDVEGAIVTASFPARSLAVNALIIAATDHTLWETARAWYVGTDSTPPNMSPCRYKGPAGTDAVLGLFGTGLIQERAGAAFRNSGKGQAIPSSYPYSPSILTGISKNVAPDSQPDGTSVLPEFPAPDFDAMSDAFIETALSVIEDCCAPSGAIAAAPRPTGPDEPDYWFCWPRDAGQVVLALTELTRGPFEGAYAGRARAIVERYLSFVSRLSRELSPSELGTSRFTVEGEPVTGYGNPQDDGLALTVLALLLDRPQSRRSLQTVRPFLEALVRVASNGLGFDCWEFVVAENFATLNLIRRALERGALVFQEFGWTTSAQVYGHAAGTLRRRLATYYDSDVGYLRSSREAAIAWFTAMEGLDASVIGSIVTAYDPADDFMNVDDPRIVDTVQALERRFIDRWPVNRRWKASGWDGMGVGRFPEDTNDGLGSTGGNPWAITTLWLTQYNLRLVQRQAYKRAGLYARDALARADAYLQFLFMHVNLESLSEQVDGQSGRPRGARRMSWVHAELAKTLSARSQVRHLVKIAPR